jgi:outer membrane protein
MRPVRRSKVIKDAVSKTMPILRRFFTAAMAAAACFSYTGTAQTGAAPGQRPDAPGSFWQRLQRPYEAKSIPPVSFQNSPRLENLIRDGKLYLSLDDAIALALENNLDIELQRFGPAIAAADARRAGAGATLRGFPLTVNELPQGIGGPASPILNLPATGAPFSTSVSTNLTEVNSIAVSTSSAAITGPTPLSNGPSIPSFDPTLIGTANLQHLNAMQANFASHGVGALTSRLSTGAISLQKGFSTGGLFSAGFTTSSQTNNSFKNTYNPYTISSFTVNFTQPLLRGFGPAVNKRFIRIARNNLTVSDLVFKQQVISTIAGVIRLYFDLVTLQEDVQVKQQTIALVQELYDDNKEKVDQGTLAPIELVRAEAQMASGRQDLANSQGFEQQQQLVLKNVLSRSGISDPVIHEARIVPTTPAEVPEVEDLKSVQEMAEIADRNRPELEEGRLQLANTEISIEGARSLLRPQLDLVVTAQNSGLAGELNRLAAPGFPFEPALVGGFGSLLGQILRWNYPTYGAGIQLSLPLHNHVAQADYARDEIQLRQTQVRYQQLQNQIRLEVEAALTALNRARAAYAAASEARKLQQKSLDVELEKYAAGVSTTFLVTQYQSFLAQARSTEVSAKSVYMKAKTALERALGLTLENHNISLDEAMRGEISRRTDIRSR